jgi:aldose 1-epimerase
MPAGTAADSMSAAHPGFLVADILHIGDARLGVSVAPSAGGRIVRMVEYVPADEAGHGAAGRVACERDWLEPLAASSWPAHAWPKAGCYPLMPFSNRVRDGVLHAGGERIVLERLPGQAHALHGYAQFFVWEALEHAPARLTMAYRHPAGRGGIGLHPYFQARAVRARAGLEWRHNGDEMAMSAHARPPGYRHRRDGATRTDFLARWDGRALLDGDDGRRLKLRAGSKLSHLVVHEAAGRDYLCVEPVSHVCDAFNLAAAGHADTGLVMLEPGHAIEARISFAIAGHSPLE